MAISTITFLGATLTFTFGVVNAQSPFSIDTDEDIRRSAALLAHDTTAFYTGNQTGQTPGILPGPPPQGDYYWWQGGALWGTLMDYWFLTGDSSYNDVVMQAMLFQVGENKDYQPRNVTASLGNDDQAFWGMSAMLAAELNFPNPPSDQPQWLALAQAVFNTQADPERHDNECGGGLRWQITRTNNGFDYKNTIANGCFFNMGARLARYTGNETYSKLAEETWDWIQGVGYITDEWDVYDGGHIGHNCTDINKLQYSYNAAVLIQGAAFMWNITEDQIWKDRINGLVDRTIELFFRDDGVAYEISCEPKYTCSTDMYSYKGYTHRWLAQSSQVAPFIRDKVMPILKSSAKGAISQCTGGDNGRECGFAWSSGKFDGKIGAGQEMSALAAVSSLLTDPSKGPVTADKGGTSKGDPNAGSHSTDNLELRPITTADRVGAGILTTLLLAGATGTFGWMIWEPSLNWRA
ncbi:probable DFG5 protein [Cephalotrichum gorgonifer]|uniref:Mannan endo-1,6-alpha-mannosidase n=1 Tax=Cephalotrichum gorgonifer TaxID=2041049 RepID=A0AAE8T026_9PEZI|nr:probable DFG5 protein [Cephalotrichum gorgonifer]